MELIKARRCAIDEDETGDRQILQGFQLHCARNNLKKYDTPLPEGAASPYRERSVEENLKLFDEMQKGAWKEGECCLRMKGDLRSDITSMWDLAAYRVKFEAHPHSGDKYCVCPLRYTHCLVDSLEASPTPCALEFESVSAQRSDYWLLDASTCTSR